MSLYFFPHSYQRRRAQEGLGKALAGGAAQRLPAHCWGRAQPAQLLPPHSPNTPRITRKNLGDAFP